MEYLESKAGKLAIQLKHPDNEFQTTKCFFKRQALEDFIDGIKSDANKHTET